MDKIQIVPVIEIKDGKTITQAVERKGEYRELVNKITNSSNPLDIAHYYEEVGFPEIFVADLDGMLEDNPNYDLLKELALKNNLSIMADIGIWSPVDVARLSKIKPVISSETFTSLNFLEFPREFVLGIDTRENVFLSGMNISLHNFLDVIKDSRKVNEILILDLSRINNERGPNIELCQDISETLPNKTFLYGGGVRHMKDVKELFDIGVDKVLVGSALHSGEMLKEIYSGFAGI